MVMNLKKVHILSLLGVLLGGIFFSLEPVLANYDPSDLTQMSAAKFWAVVNNLNPEMKNKDYIICGTSVCDPEGDENKGIEPQRCVVKVSSSRSDMVTKATDLSWAAGAVTTGTSLAASSVGAGATVAVAGAGTVAAAPVVAGAVVAGATVYATGKAIQVVRGKGHVTTYEYKCVNKSDKLDPGWAETAQGGWVTRKKVRVGGWFDTTKERGTCFGGKSGSTYCLTAKNGMATVNYNQADTAFRGCEVLPVKLYNARKCFFCPLFTVVYKVAGEMTSISFEAFAGAFALLIALGLAIWIAVQTLSQVSSLTKQDAPKFLTGLIKQSYKFLIAFFLLQYSSQIFDRGVVPILSAGLDFGDALLDERYTTIKISAGISDMEKMEEVNPGILKRIEMLKNSKYYNSDLYLKLDNFVVNLQRNIAFMQGVGSSLVCIGTNALTLKGKDVEFKHGFVLTIQGVLLAGFGFLLSIAFAFYLADAVVQMGIAGALMPFLIACWPFKLTSKYASTGGSMLLNSAFVFAFSGLVLSVNLKLIDAAVNFTATEAQTENVQTLNNDKAETSEDRKEGLTVNFGGLYQIAQAINAQAEQELVKLTDMSTVGFLILLFCCIFGFKFLGRASELAGKFAGGALKPIAPSIATMAGSAAKSFALKATQSTREAAWEKVKAGGHALASLPGRAFGALRGKSGAKSDADSGGSTNAAAGGGEGEGASENEETLGSEDNATPGTKKDDAIRVSENGSANAQNVKPQAAATGQFKSQNATKPEVARMSEGMGNAQGSPQKANSAAGEKNKTANSKEEAKVEKARQSGGRRKQGGKPKNSSRKRRSKNYRQRRNRRRR